MSQTLRAGQWYGQTSSRLTVSGNVLSRLDHTEARRVPPHTHERAYISVVLSGAYRERFADREVEYLPLTMVFHPACFAHYDEIGEGGARFFAVEFDPRYLDMLSADSRPVVELQGGEPAWIATELYRHFRNGPDPLAAESLIAELVLALSRRRPAQDRQPPHWLAQVEERLRVEFLEPPSLVELASDVRIHPVHLSRTFRHFRNQSIAHMLWRLKVQHAARLLIGPERSLAGIAADCGFADQSHFTRIFKRITRQTPAGFRHAMADGADARSQVYK